MCSIRASESGKSPSVATAMRSALVLILLVAIACKRESSAASVSAGSSDNAANLALEDSILDELPPGRTAMTTAGDTLSRIGGGLIASGGASDYGVDEYW